MEAEDEITQSNNIESVSTAEIIEATRMENAAAAETPETNKSESVLVSEIVEGMESENTAVISEMIERIEIENVAPTEIPENNGIDNIAPAEITETREMENVSPIEIREHIVTSKVLEKNGNENGASIDIIRRILNRFDFVLLWFHLLFLQLGLLIAVIHLSVHFQSDHIQRVLRSSSLRTVTLLNNQDLMKLSWMVA